MSGINLAARETAFYTWVKSRVPEGWKVVWGDQNAPKPGAKEIELRKGNPYVRKIGRDVHGSVNTSTGARKVLGTRELNIELRAYGPDALQVAEDLRAIMDDDVVDDLLIAQAMTIPGVGDVQNLTRLYGSQFKEVANIEIRIRTHSLREDADAEPGVGYIQTVDLEVTTKDPAGASTVENIHVTSP